MDVVDGHHMRERTKEMAHGTSHRDRFEGRSDAGGLWTTRRRRRRNNAGLDGEERRVRRLVKEEGAYDVLLRSFVDGLGGESGDDGLAREALQRRKREEEGDSGGETEDGPTQDGDRRNAEGALSSGGGTELDPQSLAKEEETNTNPSEDDEIEATTDQDEAGSARLDEEEFSPGQDDPFRTHLERELDSEAMKSVEERKMTTYTDVIGEENGMWQETPEDHPPFVSLDEASIRPRLLSRWRSLCRPVIRGETRGKNDHTGNQTSPADQDFESSFQKSVFQRLNSYRDVLVTNHTLEQSTKQSNPTRDVCLLHVLNHILKTSDYIRKNNKLMEEDPKQEPPRDQGFTRPKVLFLVPLRHTALALINRMMELAPSVTQKRHDSVVNRDKLAREYALDPDQEELEPARVKEARKAKPIEYQQLFGGNSDDAFRMGIKFTKKSVKLFVDFYAADAIVASPLSLITQRAEGKPGVMDYLSSIEMVVVDQADVLFMQNWQHTETVLLNIVNKLPAEQHGADFTRIRNWYLNSQSCHYRQLVMLTSFTNAEMNALFSRAAHSHAGRSKWKVKAVGVLSRVIPRAQQVYERFPCPSIQSMDDKRFEYFCKEHWPSLKSTVKSGVLIFVRTYFEFVRLRNFMRSEAASLVLLSEYSKRSDISRGRSNFFHGNKNLMLYSERAHFYYRFTLRGVHEVFFYSLPEQGHYYAELLNMMEGTDAPLCTVLYCKYDKLQLERVVGKKRAQRLLQAESSTFMFQ